MRLGLFVAGGSTAETHVAAGAYFRRSFSNRRRIGGAIWAHKLNNHQGLR
jgi:hypothetical protein